MENIDDDFPLPGIENHPVNQVNEVKEHDSFSDIDPYYSDDSVTTDEKSNTSIPDKTTELYDSMQTEQMEESEHLKEESDITLIEVYPDRSMVNLNSNGLKQCGNKALALERYYKEYLRRETIEPYPLHHLEVSVLWIPVIEEMSATGDYRRLIQLIRSIKDSADELLEADPIVYCTKAFHVYIDLNISLIKMKECLSDPGCIFEDSRNISMQISRCFLFMGQYRDVCHICKKIDAHSPIKPGNSAFKEFFLVWIEALIKLKNTDIAKKKIEHYLELTTTKEDQVAVTPMFDQIYKLEEERRKIKDEVVDSDNEYVKDSNYTGIKQQKMKVEEIKEKHQKKKRYRPKREHEPLEFFTMPTSWNGFQGKWPKILKELPRSNECISSPKEDETLHIPKGHEISDVESDDEFDKMARDNWIGSDYTTSDDEADGDNEPIDYYEQSVKMYENNHDNELNEHDVLTNGIILSEKFLDQHSRSKHKKHYFQYEEFYEKEKMKELCKRYPNKFKICTVKLEAAHRAICKNTDHSGKISEIEISGRSKIGKVFNDDEVCVEILKDEIDEYKRYNHIGPRLNVTVDTSTLNLKVYGQIRGIMKRNHHAHVKHPVFVSMLDEAEYHLMRPVSKAIPKLHIMNRNCTNDYQIDVYNYDKEKGELEHKELFNIKPGEVGNYIFLVALICWHEIYPRGAVIKVLNAKSGMNTGMEILKLQHQVPTTYKKETIENLNWLLELDEPLVCKKDRVDLTGMEVVTIDPSNARDLDDALSIEELNDIYRVGVHIADVTSYIEKGSHIDVEAYQRATTFYPGQGINPYHMLPKPLSTKLCSLIPGETRPTISIFFTFDKKEGLQKHLTEIKRSQIKSIKQLSYKEAQDIILKVDTTISDSLCKQVNCLFKLAKNQRITRLGSGMFYFPMAVDGEDDDFTDTLEAHYLVEEFMILANHTIGKFLIEKFKDCIPLRVQQPPNPEQVRTWLESHEFYADLIVKLQEIRPSPTLWHDRKLTIDNTPTARYTKLLMYQHWVWKKLLLTIERKDYTAASQLIGCDDLHPFSCLALDEWYEYQERAEYKCSGEVRTRQDGSHFTLGMFPYTQFTSPIRRYLDIIVHRLLHCALDKKGPCYTKHEVSELCCYLNEVTRRAKNYQKQCRALTWGYKLMKEPQILHGFLKTVSDKEVSVVFPGHRYLPKSSKTLQLNYLNAAKKPEFKTDRLNGRKILELTWKKRLYSFNGYTPIKKKEIKEDGYRLNPHNRGFFQQQRKWKQILERFTAAKSPKDKMKKLLETINDDGLGDSKENVDKLVENVPSCFKTVKDVSSEVREGSITLQSCQFTMTFNHQQIIPLQLSAESVKGVLIPQIEIFDMTKNVKHCFLHVKDPIKYLEQYATSPSKERYFSAVDYLRTWKPLVEMESASNSVKSSTATINDVPVKFLSQYEGKFSLSKGFCDQRNIEINKTPLSVFLTDNEEAIDEENEEGIKEIASPDYICIKCPIFKSQIDKWDLIKGNIAPSDYIIWIAHAKIDRAQVRKGKTDFIFRLHRNSKPVPLELMKEDNRHRHSIEIIFKSSADQRIDAVLQCLNKATALAKAIALGTSMPKLDKGHLKLGRDTEPDVMNIGLVGNNKQQYNAIQRALTTSFSLIQGPPGTGKTYTGIKLVYLFDQINMKWKEMGNEKKQIIFCGPSNKSVDLVASWMKRRLGDNCPQMVRWYGSSIEDQEYPIPGKTPPNTRGERAKADENLRKVSMHILIRQVGKPYQEDISAYDRQFKQHPDGVDYKVVTKYRSIISKAVIEEVKLYDVIFCTTAMATNPKLLKGTRGRIFQIIIDECGMCTEPESITAIIATRAEQVVLIGDHRQLRPIVKSTYAAKLGLEKSLFERYANKATLLTSQYRMNPQICAFASQQFYNNKLKTKPSYMWMTDIPLRSWINKDIPVIFCNVAGKEDYLPFDTDEGNEQSCSNQEEVEHVVKIFKHLVDEELIDPEYNINIMSQYNAQCTAIRKALKAANFIKFNVNTVVASQGGEWDYVIMSLVRSLPHYRIEPNPTLGWCKQNLGFITDEHQTNVALTRARKGLIVVGHKELLTCNEVWGSFINHYGRRGCVVDREEFPPKPVPKRIKKKSKNKGKQTFEEQTENLQQVNNGHA
ncbi:helicase with zinc finger domain 2-like [Mytilus californianus]|uniref:helicase with zinc finger domain 2-like n=1 Tax=Mytilus californianus TaxID=6549 RepID=UPI002247E84A|nr:helicase with zinc finger domain 2-like [Mytilus californianus]XP_052090431.1 helicase with zinc finger domain 2-like [Mytilus californianus]